MPTLTYSIASVTRTNAITTLEKTIKKVRPAIDGVPLVHEYTYDGATTDATAKAAVKADLEGPKGYGALTEG